MNKLLYDKFGQFKIKAVFWPLFWVGLLIKLLLAFNFGSDYLTKLFIPFLNYFVDSSFANPYQHFADLANMEAFPYPAAMLWIMASPKIIFSSLGIQSNALDLLLYRLPLLLADLSILLVLSRWLKTENKRVLVFYWLSPILIYISYIHGQLDVIPIAFLFVSLYFLFKEKFLLAALALGLALATKTHIAILLPFFFIYFYRARTCDWTKLIASILLCFGIFALCNLPYLNNPAYLDMVYHNSQQVKIFNLSYQFSNGMSFYFIPAIYLVLLLSSLQFKINNRDVFVMFLGFSFGLLLALIPPMQGWYFWILPFFIYFYIRESRACLVFVLLNIFYFAYFALASSPGIAASLALTLLQMTLVINCIWVYQAGLKANLDYKIKSKPYLIGVAGDSGAGKTTFSNLISKIFNEQNTTIVRGDDMHKYERGHYMWDVMTHLNPKANKLHDDMSDALMLKQGERVYRRHYDHSEGKFTLPKEIQSNKVVIFEGLHAFYLSKMREILDLKVFIKPDEELRKEWKIERDVNERQHGKDKVLEQIENRKEDSEKFVLKQEKYADIILSFVQGGELKFSFDNQIHMEKLVDALDICKELDCEHYYDEEKQFLKFKGQVDSQVIEFLVYQLVPELDEIISLEAQWEDGLNGLIQLVACYYIFEKMKLEAA